MDCYYPGQEKGDELESESDSLEDGRYFAKDKTVEPEQSQNKA